MSLQANLEGSRILVTGKGLDLLRVKSRINQVSGDLVTRGEKNGSFSFSASLLPLVATELPTEGLSADVLDVRDKFVEHEMARQRILEYFASNDIGIFNPPWDDILDPLQALAVHGMTEPGLLGFCLFDEQGSGKTVMGMAAFDTLVQKKLIDSAIIVCPKSLIGSWEGDFNKFLPGKYLIATAEGTAKERFEKIVTSSDVLLITYEVVSAELTILKGLASAKKVLLVIDESFFAKNPEANRTSSLIDLRSKCSRCFALCGTPAPNSFNDVVSQFDIADLGYTFAGHDDNLNPYDESDAVQEKIETRGAYLRREKKIILPDLPPKFFQIKSIALTGRQQILYETAKNELHLSLRSMDNKSFRKNLMHYFQKRNALLQICSCPSAVDPLFKHDHVKILAVDELLNEIIDKGQRKVLLWSFYRHNLDEAFNRYKHYNPVKIDGSSTQQCRRDAVNQFQNNPAVKLFIGNPAAAGAGLTLHAASDAIYMSFSNQAAHHLQSLDRIHRRGQTAKETNYYFLICDGTIEVTDLARLRRKELDQSNLLGDSLASQLDLDSAIQELL